MKLLSIGEVLWDLIDGQAHIGGATLNLAAHAVRFGMEAWLVSAVGDDDLGRRAIARVRELGIRDDYVRTVDTPTGVVDVSVDEQGVPTFTIREPAAWDVIELSQADIDALRVADVDAICYGSLAQRRETIERRLHQLLDALRGDGRPKLFCDINLRAPFIDPAKVRWSIAAADILKLNNDEVKVCCGIFDRPFEGMEQFCEWVSRAQGLEIMCVTLGAEGCLVYAGGQAHWCEGVPTAVDDTVGSGDAFSAAFLQRYLSGASPAEAGQFANRVGAFIASKAGAVPDYDPSDIET